MERIYTVAQMREADTYTIRTLGVPAQSLMERAGLALAECVEEMSAHGEVICVCGSGNNGGDGYVCAKVLAERGGEVVCVAVGEGKSAEARLMQSQCAEAGVRIQTEFPERGFAVVVDCLLGTGFHGEPQGTCARAIAKINDYKRAGAKVLSADIPSGLNGDNGLSKGCVQADVTVCIGGKKAGVYFGDGMDVSGKLLDADIGIKFPHTDYANRIERTDIARLLPTRKRNSHKGTYGKVAIVGGSQAYAGAGYLSAYGCLRAGAGYTYVYVPQAVLPYYVLRRPEYIVKPLDGRGARGMGETLDELLSMQAIAYGMGMGVSQEVCEGAEYLLSKYTGKLVLDADGLNALAKYAKGRLADIFAQKQCEVILTPHVKEFARLCPSSVAEIIERGMCAPVAFAKAHGVSVLLKGAVTTVTDGSRILVNTAGSAGQAKGGSGDALAGVIAGLLGQGLSAMDGGIVGAYLLGRSAELLEKEHSAYSILASDVLDNLGRAIAELYTTE